MGEGDAGPVRNPGPPFGLYLDCSNLPGGPLVVLLVCAADTTRHSMLLSAPAVPAPGSHRHRAR